ncbi:MAG: YihA family ribosome biogenesis GTP-binding protein [Betaproteobacteria bacterium]|nr:YihA family ribosome biogenesis GTP-binding protein [Betaproteobacteria bacterium]
MGLFDRAVYTASAHDLEQLPPDLGREVAFVGRSNAGKSSAINTLANHKRLAFVSKTPGRTQLINFFSLGDDRSLVDLPGYGYAQVPARVKAHWQGVLAAYVSSRLALKGLVLIMDARHPLKPLDLQLLDWYLPTGKPVHCLLTKSDKLSRNEQSLTLQKVRQQMKAANHQSTVQLFSSLKKQGVEEAEAAITRLFGAPET